MRLLLLIRNAAGSVRGTDLGHELLSLEEQVRNARPFVGHVALTTQVYLFDLWKAVMKCIAELPSSSGLSGYLLPGSTQKLLQYFSESLRHRGSETKAWSRSRLPSLLTLAKVEPVQSPRKLLVDKVDSFRDLLSRRHVIWPLYIEDMADAHALWTDIRARFCSRK